MKFNMKKRSMFIFVVITCLFLINFVSSASLDVQKTDKGSVIISELNNPAVFELTINNLGSADMFEIYSLVGLSFSPKGTFALNQGNNKIEVMAYANKDIRSKPGVYSFEYKIRGQNSGIFTDTLGVTIAELSSALQIKPVSITPGDSKVNVTIRSNLNSRLDNVSVHLKSAFFESTQEVSLGPYEEVSFSLPINQEGIAKLIAGPYPFTAELKLDSAKAKYTGTLNYLEKEGLRVERDSSGFIIYKISVSKINEGNVPKTADVEITKDILPLHYQV